MLSDIDIQNLDEQIKSKIAEVLYELKEKYARQQGTFGWNEKKIDINNYQYDDEDFDGLEQEYMENRPKSSKQGFKAYDRGVCNIFSDKKIACWRGDPVPKEFVRRAQKWGPVFRFHFERARTSAVQVVAKADFPIQPM